MTDRNPAYDGPMGVFTDYDGCDSDPEGFVCDHIGIVSISEMERQCMDCLRIWPKEPGFKSDWPNMDRG